MQPDDFDYLELDGNRYLQVTHFDGVQTKISQNTFEIATRAGCTINEQDAIKRLREWIQQREKALRDARSVSGD
jgi:hypothetical protein